MTSLLFVAMIAAAPATLVPAAPPPAAASGASGSIDPEAATRAYLDQLPADQRARSDAYFEGGYWLSLWTFLWGAGVFVLLLQTRASARMRDFAERITRFRPLQTATYWTQFVLALAVLSFPLSVYRDYVREHAYGLSNLTFGGWLGEELKGLAISVVLGSLAMIALYAVVRRLPRTWWMWGAVVAIAFEAFGVLIGPVLIDPLFNHPKKLEDARVVAPILSMARANGIDAGEVWEIDASKQSKRVSANVSGLLGTERITLNDNLLNRCSLPEIEAVMGHEMGHYVLNHIYKGLMELGIVIVAGFALVARLFERLRRRSEARWRVRDIGDLAGLPLAALLLSAYLFVLTPALNSIVRVQEYEADLFGLNAARQPDGFAQAALKLSEYRKLEPGPLEEMIFFDHPSGRTRILSAMRWKAGHPAAWAAAQGKSAPPSAERR
ncbi:MAG: M48 family metallopeptidase [Myxococcales bacterium]